MMRGHMFWFDWSVRAKILSVSIVVIVFVCGVLLVGSYYNTQQRSTQTTAEALLGLSEQVSQRAESSIEGSVKSLEALALSPQVIELVEQKNKEHAGLTDEQIAALDQGWKDQSETMAATVDEISNNSLSANLKDFMKRFPEQVEVFVTDVKGLNVAMTDRTSDYLQGDEGWWQQAYNNGQGKVFVDTVEYDESTKVYAMNIGVRGV